MFKIYIEYPDRCEMLSQETAINALSFERAMRKYHNHLSRILALDLDAYVQIVYVKPIYQQKGSEKWA